MPTQSEIEAKFWKALKSDRTVMLGLTDADDGLAQPMTVQLEQEGRGPLWIFTARDTDLVQALRGRAAARVNFAAKDHEVFAALEGDLAADNDPAAIERLWNPFVAAWFEGGKTDPNLQLLRFEPAHAQIWLNDNSLFAGVKILLGSDPKKDYADKVAEFRI